MTFSKTIPKKISTSGKSRPDTPTLEISNPLKKDIFVNAIELTPSRGFTRKGKILILINDVPFFSNQDESVNPFKDFGLFSVPLEKQKLARGRKIQIFIWNPDDSDVVKVTVSVTIGETSENLSRGSLPNPLTKSTIIGLTDNYESGETIYTVPSGKSAIMSEATVRLVAYGGGVNPQMRFRVNGIKVVNFDSTVALDIVGVIKYASSVGLSEGQIISVTRSPATGGEGNLDVSVSVEEFDVE